MNGTEAILANVQALGEKVFELVEASDRLVNLLNGPAPTLPASARRHGRAVSAAFDRYEAARNAIVGDPFEEDDAED